MKQRNEKLRKKKFKLIVLMKDEMSAESDVFLDK